MKDQDQIDQEYRVEAAEIARPGIEPLIPVSYTHLTLPTSDLV